MAYERVKPTSLLFVLIHDGFQTILSMAGSHVMMNWIGCSKTGFFLLQGKIPALSKGKT